MANHHRQARTTIGAADPIVDWFATFEAWITATVGWTVVLGAGTTDMFLSSVGEPGSGYTMLFVHIWRVGVGNTVRMEVADDAIPTHQTNEAGLVDSGGAGDFYFWMTANLEAIVIAWQLGTSCRFIYAGALMPYGTTPTNETYHMVATTSHATSSILRNSAGLWDQDINNYDHGNSDDVVGSVDSDVHHLFGLYADRQNMIAGQFWFISGEINGNANITFGDTLNSALAGYNSSWVVLIDHIGNKFALWTGGTWPPGYPDVGLHFASGSGVGGNGPHLVGSIAAWAVAHGWVLHGNPGFPRADPGDSNERMTSAGEQSEGQLNLTISWDNSAGRLEFFVHDDALYTHYTYSQIAVPAFPAPFYEAGDRDCVVAAVDNTVLTQFPCLWGGKVAMASPVLTDPVNMKMVASALDNAWQTSAVLRGRDGVWVPGATLRWGDNNTRLLTNGNAYDATTYFAHPIFTTSGLYPFIGINKYMCYTNGGGIAQLDNIMVNGVRQHMVFIFNNTPRYWCMRVS